MTAFLLRRSEEQVMLDQSLRRLVDTHATFEPGRHRKALWPLLAELGALGALFGEKAGGFGGAPLDIAIVIGATAKGLLAEPLLTTAMCARLLQAAGRTELSAEVIAGSRVVVLAHQEGFDPFARPALAASGTNRLTGKKIAVRHADIATDLLVTARLGDGKSAVFLVPAIAGTKTRLIDGPGAADLDFDGVVVEESARLSLPDADAQITDALEWGLTALAVETAMLAEVATAATCDYLDMREQFGQKLATFQALQHKVANMTIAAQSAAAMASAAVAALSSPASRERSRKILTASIACDDAGRTIGHEAVQLFGGVGVSDELVVSHYARRLVAARYQIGSIDARLAQLAGLS